LTFKSTRQETLLQTQDDSQQHNSHNLLQNQQLHKVSHQFWFVKHHKLVCG